MAIIRDVPGISVEIKVGKAIAQEYDNEEEPPSAIEVTKYIEAQSKKCFTIPYRIEPHIDRLHRDLSVHLYIDGQFMDSWVVCKEEYVNGEAQEGSFEGFTYTEDGELFLQKFRFADLAVDEDNQTTRTKEELMGLGSIVVCIHTTTIESTYAPDSHDSVAEDDHEVFNEKDVKGRAISHHTDFDDPIPKPGKAILICNSKRTSKESFATFVFKYRSKKALQDLMIIPRPVPLEDRPWEELSEKEREQAFKVMQKREQTPYQIKREHDDEGRPMH